MTSAVEFTVEERDWNPSAKAGWFAMAEAPPRTRPPLLATKEAAALPPIERRRYDQARAAWHANLGPIRTPQVDAVFDALEEICGSNLQDGGKVRPAAVLDALPGLGKTTAALAFGRWFHREQVEHARPAGAGRRRDVAADPGRLPGADLAYHDAEPERDALPVLRAARAGQRRRAGPPRRRVRADCKTRLVIVDDVHFLDISRRDGSEVANHFKWLANVFPVTFLFVGVGLRARGLLDEGLAGADAAFSQTARRWNVLSLGPFEIRTQEGQRTWRKLLLGIERELVLSGAWRGMIAGDLAEYLFARSTGHFASLMSLISRGCYRAVKTGAESLTASLLDAVRIDQAAEDARGQLQAAIGTGRSAARPGTRASAPAAGEAAAV